MPVYEYVCDECTNEREEILPFKEAGKKLECECGGAMRQRFSLSHFTIKVYNKDKILNTLNEETKRPVINGGETRSKRSQDALASGLSYVRPLEDKVFTGF